MGHQRYHVHMVHGKWSDCDCENEPQVRTRHEQAFPEGCEDRIDEQNCADECNLVLIEVYEESGDHSGDDIDDNEYDRDDYSISNDDSLSVREIRQLKRTTRERYRRSVEAEIAELNENEF